MMNEEWSMKIIRTNNGYIVSTPSESQDMESQEFVLEDNDADALRSHQDLLYEVMDYFAFSGSKYDKERLKVVREKGDKYNNA